MSEITRNGGDHQNHNGTKQKKRPYSPARVVLPEVEPWAEPVNGAVLLDRILYELQRFVMFPKWGAEMLALWILHTFAFHLRSVTTYVAIESPERECGKSTLLTVLSLLVKRAAVSSNISSSAFFHAIDELRPTLLIDEADSNLKTRRELRGIFNAGYTESTANVWRVIYEPAADGDTNGDEAEEGGGRSNSKGRLVRYLTWCPKVIATIGRLDATLESRCIVIRMERKLEVEECERVKLLQATELNQQCARFVQDHASEIANATPAMPEGLGNRAADIWEPLLALADLAGGHWPETARQAAQGLTARAQQHTPMGSLLMDICLMFLLGQTDRLFSREMVEALEWKRDRPWAELRRGRKLTESWLATQLRPYGISPRTIRKEGEMAKGYFEEDFKETFRRYIPKAEVEAARADLEARVVPQEEDKATKPQPS